MSNINGDGGPLFDEDEFDLIDHSDPPNLDVIAPGMLAAIRQSLEARFEVPGEVVVRTVLLAPGGYATIRWAVGCSDTQGDDDRRRTGKAVVVHGLSMVGPGSDRGSHVVSHYIDWAGVMGQLGMTTGRPTD